MSFSSEQRKPARRSIVRTILITLLIGFPSSGVDLGRPGSEIVRQETVKTTTSPPQQAWTPYQMDQLKSQMQIPPLSEVPGNYNEVDSGSFDMFAGAVRELRQRHLLLPLGDLKIESLRDSFSDSRGSHRAHEAIDILAPRNAPVLAVEDGSIARLWYSKPGGITIYQFDSRKEYEYYYAHLDSYAHGLKEGDQVRRGQVIGYVGTTGNAPKDTPHLHFTIFKLPESKKWWEGTPVNPYLVLR